MHLIVVYKRSVCTTEVEMRREEAGRALFGYAKSSTTSAIFDIRATSCNQKAPRDGSVPRIPHALALPIVDLK